jgi:hypothetical protein
MGASIGSGPEIGPPMGAQLVAGATSPARAAQVIPVDHRRPFKAHLGNTVRARVEQTFGCLQRYRRLRVDDEMSCESSRGMNMLVALFMIGMRLERRLTS